LPAPCYSHNRKCPCTICEIITLFHLKSTSIYTITIIIIRTCSKITKLKINLNSLNINNI
jgi:hypothetical protein